MVEECFRDDPLAGTYNLAGLKDVVPTCHPDWAPGYGVETVLALQAGLAFDTSTFLWDEPFCQRDLDDVGMARFSYMWEDGIRLDTKTPMTVEAVNISTPGLKILNVHPILIYLNFPDEDRRPSVARRYADLTVAPKPEIDSQVYRGYGVRNFCGALPDHRAQATSPICACAGGSR